MTKNHSNSILANSQVDKTSFEWFCSNPVIQWNAGIMLVKNLEHQFIASNSIFSKYSGFSPESLIGVSDDEMPWAENKSIYVKHEKDVLSGLDYNVIEPLPGIVKACLLTSKKVIHSVKGIPCGTIATAIVFKGTVEFGNLAGASDNMKICNYSEYNLTVYEAKVLYFLLKGFSRQKVSEMSRISTSSYDFHLQNIKRKFNVETRDQLVFLCYEKGFHETMPFQLII